MQPSLLLHRCPSRARRHYSLHWLVQRLFLSVLALSLILAAFRPALAQYVPERQWSVFRRAADGLLSSNVYAILADGDHIWLGSDQGINRFDGSWLRYDTTSMRAWLRVPQRRFEPGKVTALAKPTTDADGIWFATSHGHIGRLRGFSIYYVASVNSPVNAMVDRAGVLWLATDRGLLTFDGHVLKAEPGPGAVAVHALTVDGDGALWAGADDGLWHIAVDGTTQRFVPTGKDVPATAQVTAVLCAGHGSLWLGMGQSLVNFKPETGEATGSSPFASINGDFVVTSIVQSHDSIWAATSGAGVVQITFADDEQTSMHNVAIDASSVRTIAIDQDGSVWFASPAGVFRYQIWAWQDLDLNLAGLSVNDLLVDRAGNLWIATVGEGVQRRRSLYAGPDSGFPDRIEAVVNTVNDLDLDATGSIWAATNYGVAKFANGKWTQPIDTTRLPAANVRSIQADAQGIWIGTENGLMQYRFADQSLREELQFAGKAVSLMAADGLGHLWISTTDGGLWQHADSGAWLEASKLGGMLPSDSMTTALLADPKTPGALYAALLDGGIYRWNGNEWLRIDRGLWNKGDWVYALYVDPADGSLWIASVVGLSRLDAYGMTTFDYHDGVPGGSMHAILRGPDGAYWFGGQRGLTQYRPEHTPPWVWINDTGQFGVQLRADGWQVYADQPAELKYSATDLQANREQLAVFYRIEGQDPQGFWRQADPGLIELNITRPGDYELQVKSRDSAFNYSDTLTREIHVVLPPTLVTLPMLGEVKTSVFQLLIIFGALSLFGFGYVSYEIVAHRLRIYEAVRRGYNPYISGEPVRREDMFFGRQELLARIVATLHNNSIMVHGERRIGKTTLLYQLGIALHHVRDAEYWFMPVFVDLEGTAEEKLFGLLMDETAQQVALLPGLTEADQQQLKELSVHKFSDGLYTDREFGRDLRALVRWLEDYSDRFQDGKHPRLILLLDEVDTLTRFDHIYQQQLRRIFMRDFASTLGAVVAGIEISKDWDRVESPWYNMFNEIAIMPFSRQQAIELLVEPVRGYYIFEPDAIEFVIENSEGRPYRIQQYALEAVNHMLRHKRRRIKLVDVEFAYGEIAASTGNGLSNRSDQNKETPPSAPAGADGSLQAAVAGA